MNPDFRDLLRALCDAEARFLVIGAYAVSIHAEPRATGHLTCQFLTVDVATGARR